MITRGYSYASIVGVALLVSLTACSPSGATPEPTSMASPVSPELATPPTKTPSPENKAIQAEAETIFNTLPAGAWVYTYTDQGSSALMDNILIIEDLRIWTLTLEVAGWQFTPGEDNANSFIGSLTKEGKIINVLSAINPETNTPTTAVFYYSDVA